MSISHKFSKTLIINNFLSPVFRAEKTNELCKKPTFDTLIRLGIKYNYKFPWPYSGNKFLKNKKHLQTNTLNKYYRRKEV